VDVKFTFRHPDDPDHKIRHVLLTDFSSKIAIKKALDQKRDITILSSYDSLQQIEHS
jgi:hypothetical protein